jgi:hypothetical protein
MGSSDALPNITLVTMDHDVMRQWQIAWRSREVILLVLS